MLNARETTQPEPAISNTASKPTATGSSKSRCTRNIPELPTKGGLGVVIPSEISSRFPAYATDGPVAYRVDYSDSWLDPVSPSGPMSQAPFLPPNSVSRSYLTERRCILCLKNSPYSVSQPTENEWTRSSSYLVMLMSCCRCPPARVDFLRSPTFSLPPYSTLCERWDALPIT